MRGGVRRVALTVLVLVLLGAGAAHFILVNFAADLFAGAVQQAAQQFGLAIEFDNLPQVVGRGFEAGGVTVRDALGEELLRAENVSGNATFFLRAPYVGVSLKLADARVAVSQGDSGQSKKAEKASTPWSVPALPTVVSEVVLENAKVELGPGRELVVDGQLRRQAEGTLMLQFTRLDYTEASGELVAENLVGSLEAASVADSKVRLALAATSGAALSGSILLDFAAHPVAVAGVVSQSTDGAIVLADLVCTLGKLLRLTGRVDLKSDGQLRSADVEVSSGNLLPAFVALVRDPFGGVLPALAEAELEGQGSLRVRMTAPSRHATDVTISLSLASLETRAVEVKTLKVDLPWMGASLRGRSARSGRLRAQTLSLLGLPWTGVDTVLNSSAGKLRAAPKQTWKAAGGTLTISDLTLEDDSANGPRLSAGLALAGFDLARLGTQYNVKGLTGTLHGDLGRVTLDAKSLRAQGAIEVDAFGGKLRLSKLAIDDPFGRVPSLGLDAKVSEISLGAVTDFLGVGRVTGVLEGHVTDLVIAAGQPVSLDADLHTVSRRGVSQYVDVRAIVQLGVLGGGDGGAITGTLLKIIDRYRYSELGLRCQLRNDVFKIRGVRSDGGKDYIVKGSLIPPSVSVVSHSQVVSFSEMLRRIQRIAAMGEGDSDNAKPE